MTVEFSLVGSVEVGQSLTITCTITAVASLTTTPNITFLKINEIDMEMLSDLDVPYTITTDDTGAVTNYTLMFKLLRFEDAGMYTCMAEFNVTGYNNTDDSATATGDMQEANDVFILIVDCKSLKQCKIFVAYSTCACPSALEELLIFFCFFYSSTSDC